MTEHALSVPFVDGLTLLAVAVVVLWLWLMGLCPRRLCARLAFTVSGYARRRPDPAAEAALRLAFAEFDRDLTVVLSDHARSDRPGG